MPTPGASDDLRSRPIRDLGLAIAGSRLEPIAAEFERELLARGIDRVRPRLYLSTEWGVPDGTVAIAIPFYLAREDLIARHAERAGHVEGRHAADILRYLRHEMGHVVNYAYRLHESPEWTALFGPMSHPYREEYHPVPFSREFVRHLPGWYAQKHPDEDWAETFAVWMTPDSDWRRDYADAPGALRKLEYCDRAMASVAGRDPIATSDELDLDVSEIGETLDEFYAAGPSGPAEGGAWLDSVLRSIFDGAGAGDPSASKAASSLIRRMAVPVGSEVFQWTGRFPERIVPLLRRLADRAEAIGLVYRAEDEAEGIIGLAAFATSRAMTS